MHRRQFLKTLGFGAAALALPKLLLPSTKNLSVPSTKKFFLPLGRELYVPAGEVDTWKFYRCSPDGKRELLAGGHGGSVPTKYVQERMLSSYLLHPLGTRYELVIDHAHESSTLVCLASLTYA